jgi:predicted ATPase
MLPALGATLSGRWLVHAEIGRGGMGVVYAATNVEIDARVAIKVLNPALAGLPIQVRRFEQEARVTANIKSDHVARVHDLGRLDDGTPFIVMEQLEGNDLGAEIATRGAMGPGRAVDLVLQACEAIAAAHALGIVHRDLKPANLFVTTRLDGSSWVKVLDFGVVKHVDAPTTGAVIGSEPYMSPEQRSDPDRVDARADVWALGVILHRLMTATFPPKDVHPSVIVERLHRRHPEVPRGLAEAIGRCLELDRNARMASVAALAEAIAPFAENDRACAARVARILEGSGGTSMRPPPPPQADEITTRARRGGPVMRLPARSNAFFGRENDLRAIGDLFASGERAITLVGTAGVGKTRLALRAAEANAESFLAPDAGGIAFCDLTEAKSAADVVRVLERTLDVDHGNAKVATEPLVRALAARGATLLVLDNCEQVVADAADVARAILDGARDARLLFTSRERLRLDAERVVEIAPFDAAPGVALFLDRARRAAPGTDHDVAVVTEVVRMLDGLPLAIELAAARTSVLSTADLRDRLVDRLAVLDAGPRKLPAKQRTLRGALDGSWSLLEPHEQSALAQCAVFRGGFTLTSAEATMSLDRDAPPVIDVLQSLREKSLLHSESTSGELRFAMYESIRAYASEMQSADVRRETQIRHARHFVTVGRAWSDAVHRDGGTRALHRLMAELENLIAVAERGLERADADGASDALRAVLALEPVIDARGLDARTLALLDATLAVVEGYPTHRPPPLDVRARGWIARGRMRQMQGRWDDSRADLERARALAIDADDPRLEGRALTLLANLPALRGDLAEARAEYERALAVHRRAGDRRFEAFTLGNIGVLDKAEARAEQAMQRFADAFDAAREIGDARLQGHNLTRIAQLLHAQGHLDDARLHYEQALVALDAGGDRRFVALTEGAFAFLLQELDVIEDAKRRYTSAARAHRESGDRRSLAAVIGQRATLHHERGEIDEARARYAEALELLAPLQEHYYSALFLAARAALEASQDDLERATTLFAAADAAAHGNVLLSAIASVHRGHLDLARARSAAARGDEVEADRRRAAAMDRLAASAPGTPSEDLRFAHRLLERANDPANALPSIAVSDAPIPSLDDAPKRSLVVARDGAWARTLEGRIVDLRERLALRRLLAALVDHRTRAPGEAVSTSDLVRRAWPDESLTGKVADVRVHIAVTALRAAGLRTAILARAGGHLLDPDLPVARLG